jgi:hypothetical protein
LFSGQNAAVNSSLNLSQEAKHIFPVRISCCIMRSAKVAARPPLKYDRAQWMCTWSSTKSDWVSDMYSSQDVRNACPCALSLSKLLGMPGLTLEGCDAFRGVVTGGSEAGGGGARCSLASRVLNAASSLFSVLLITQVASTWSLSRFSMFWSHSASIANESTTSTTCYGGGAGGNRC